MRTMHTTSVADIPKRKIVLHGFPMPIDKPKSYVIDDIQRLNPLFSIGVNNTIHQFPQYPMEHILSQEDYRIGFIKQMIIMLENRCAYCLCWSALHLVYEDFKGSLRYAEKHGFKKFLYRLGITIGLARYLMIDYMDIGKYGACNDYWFDRFDVEVRIEFLIDLLKYKYNYEYKRRTKK